ncbi:hypothetical protein Acr_16g0000930 [Actinidia rufa]|uniref:Uncharacterized protein n=1 Tax=Actinidia rufa TaxID=165716 RepID=A0A7J0FXQ3_9ERIC|nr:hypothetical protein Acr_16g0000930 [Actinidia rufa]
MTNLAKLWARKSTIQALVRNCRGTEIEDSANQNANPCNTQLFQTLEPKQRAIVLLGYALYGDAAVDGSSEAVQCGDNGGEAVSDAGVLGAAYHSRCPILGMSMRTTRHYRVRIDGMMIGEDILVTSRGGRNSSSFQETTRSSPMDNLGSLEFRARQCNSAPSLTEAKKEGLDLVTKTLELREFYSVKNILRSKVFLKCFVLAPQQMASSGGDNVEEKNTSDAPHVTADEARSAKMDLKKLARLAKAKGDSKMKDLPLNQGERGPNWLEVVKEGPRWNRTSREATPYRVDGEEGTSVNLRAVTGLEVSVVKSSAVAEKLVQAFIPPTNKKMLEKMELDEVVTQLYNAFSKGDKRRDGDPRSHCLIHQGRDDPSSMDDLENRVAELEANKEHSKAALLALQKEVARLKKYKEDSNVTTKKLEKEVAKLKRRENLTKTLSINEFKASKEYKETIEEEASSYFSEGFDQYKK